MYCTVVLLVLVVHVHVSMLGVELMLMLILVLILVLVLVLEWELDGIGSENGLALDTLPLYLYMMFLCFPLCIFGSVQQWGLRCVGADANDYGEMMMMMMMMEICA